MRVCLPFSLHRISSSAHRAWSCQSPYRNLAMSTASGNQATGSTGSTGSILGDFLVSQRELFLADLQAGKGKGWTVSVGNEAGDLDTLASSVAFAYLSSTLKAERTVPLCLTPSRHMNLRPENLLAFQLSQIPIESLLHPENLSVPLADLTAQGVSYALVDHNRLLPQFGEGHVRAIIDHHEDEQAHADAERLIQVPTGSCASLVTQHFRPQWEAAAKRPGPSQVSGELATLLLSAILIDTAGLKKGGKAVSTDLESAGFLYPISTLAEGETALAPSPDGQAGASSVTASSLQLDPPKAMSSAATELISTKYDVSALTTPQLLLRDYKEYVLPTASSSYPTLRMGLSTVPVGLANWLGKESAGWTSYLSALDDYMAEKALDIEGVLTTFKSNKGKSKRELLLAVKEGGAIPAGQAQIILDELSEGLEASGEILDLKPWGKKKGLKGVMSKKKKANWLESIAELERGDGRSGRVWQQGNAKSTRKQVAPILRDLIAKLQ